MSWSSWYKIVSYARSSLWVVPFVAMVLEQIAMRVMIRIDAWLDWRFMGFDVGGSEAMLQTVITLTLSFIVFTFGSLLVAIQVASGQLTPRIIATTLLRDNVVRFTVGLFVFTLLFANGLLFRTEDKVFQLTSLVAILLGLASIAGFLYFIDYTARLLRPVSIVARVCEHGIRVVESVYVNAVRDPATVPRRSHPLGVPGRVVPHIGQSQIVLAVNLEALIAEAKRLNGVIEFVPQVGDFVSVGEPLFRLYGGAGAVDDRLLRTAAVFGPERTVEQDPTFAPRILVDIAIKALSPAINDPTTAVLALDQLHRLLRLVGKRDLRNENITDDAGDLRVILRTPNWQDFVHLAFREIRHYGADNIQIARRLRAMIENLMHTLPAVRHAALREELVLLDRAVETLYDFPEDRALAHIADAQGLGGASGTKL